MHMLRAPRNLRFSQIFCLLAVVFLNGCMASPKSESGQSNLLRVGNTWRSENGDVTVIYRSPSSETAFYEITSRSGQTWKVFLSKTAPDIRGVDGELMKNYALQNVYISESGKTIGVSEQAGGEASGNFLMIRSGGTWIVRAVEPKADMYKKENIAPFATLTGVTDKSALFNGVSIRFSDLKEYERFAVEPEGHVRR